MKLGGISKIAASLLAAAMFYTTPVQAKPKEVTVMCYLNGDSELSDDVLYALDQLETVGSNENMDIYALVDGKEGQYEWDGSKLLHVQKDDEIGVIRSDVIKEYDELDMGDPKTLEEFVTFGMRNDSKRYKLLHFSHGRGIINPQSTSIAESGSISSDDTNQSAMTSKEFSSALKSAVGDKKLDTLVLFSCLTNMVEIGYSLQEVTDYIISSPSRIRFAGRPGNELGIRGIRYERALEKLAVDPKMSAVDFGRYLIDDFISQYGKSSISMIGDRIVSVRHDGALAMIDTANYPRLLQSLDILADYVTTNIDDREFLQLYTQASADAHKYGGFDSPAEYYDLQGFVSNLKKHTRDERLVGICNDVRDAIDEFIVYERHTAPVDSKGISIYMSNVMIPDDVYDVHSRLYDRSGFGQATGWDEMIDSYRASMEKNYPFMLIDLCRKALQTDDVGQYHASSRQLSLLLTQNIRKGNFESTKRYIDFLGNVDSSLRPKQELQDIYRELSNSKADYLAPRLYELMQ